MSRRNHKNKPPETNGNWVRRENAVQWHGTAKQVLEQVKEARSKFDEVIIQDPTQPRCWICKLIKKQ